MASATPYDADLGTEQGRIPSSNAPLGSHYFQLGTESRGRYFRIAPDDYTQISQTFDVTGVKYLKYTVVVRGTSDFPIDAGWAFSLVLGGMFSSNIDIGTKDRVVKDQCVPVYPLTGNQEVVLQLRVSNLQDAKVYQIPGAAVDALTQVDADALLYNRVPEPDEVDVALDSTISFRIDTATGVIDLFRTKIYVDGVLAYQAGAFFGDYAGISSFNPVSFTNGVNFILLHATPFPSSHVTTVEVFSALEGGPPDTIHEVWSFTATDVEPPRVLEAFATAEDRVRVSFNETVQQGTGLSSDALRASNYSLSILGGLPAILPAVTEVTSVDGLSVVLSLSTPLTRNAVYRVTCTNVLDSSGNIIASPYNRADFVGYVCPGPEDRDFLYFERLPRAARELDGPSGDLRKYSSVIQEVIDLLLCRIDRWPDILDPDTAPEEWLDVMLADLGNPFEFELTAIEKRKLVQLLVAIYRSKGTGPGIVNAIRLFLGLIVTLNVPAWSPVSLGDATIGVDWILGSSDEGEILTFEIRTEVNLTDVQRQRLLAIVDYMSDAREFFILKEPPLPVDEPDHWQIGYSDLGSQSILH